MRRSPFVPALFLCLLLMLPHPAESAKEGGGPLEETLTVNCTDPDPTKHDNIQEAIDGSKAQSVTVQITGMCQQSVFVTRENVTLAGSDSALDGITGPAFVRPNQRALVEVQAANTTIDNLTISGSEGRGVEANNNRTTVAIQNSHVHSNAFRGVQANDGAFAQVSNSVVEDNGNWQLATFQGTLVCSGCTVGNGSESLGAVASLGGILSLQGLTLSTTFVGLATSDASRAILSGGANDVTSAFPLDAENGGIIQWAQGGTVAGAFFAARDGQIFLDNVSQTSNSSLNQLVQNSHLYLSSGSSLTGDTDVSGFSTAASVGASDLGGNLTCSFGGDFYCDGSEPKASSGCGSCP